MSADPPRDVPPDVLFRLLLGRPRPRRRIAWRSPYAPHVTLYVRGLCGVEVGSIVDAFHDLEPAVLRESRSSCEVVAYAAVLDDWRPAFRDGYELANLLDEREAAELGAHVAQALAIVSPLYSTIDSGAWHRALVTGAKAARNIHTAVVLGRCVDVAYGPTCREWIPRPERFFGGSQADLTDGQWLVFRAARAVVTSMEKD